MSQSATATKEAEIVEELYKDAYDSVSRGICFDHMGKTCEALAMYQKGLRLIDAASEISGCEQNVMYQEMVKAREHILFCMKGLKNDAGSETVPTEQLLLIENGVQLFSIRGEETSVPSYPTSLKIFKFSSSPCSTSPPAFLQVGSWVYPLVTGQSTVLHSTYGAYIFSNATVENYGNYCITNKISKIQFCL